MAGDAVFEFACERLEALSTLERIEARGTIRIALKEAGLDAKHVTRQQMAVTTRRILPGQLQRRGVEGSSTICDAIISELKVFQDEGPASHAPEDFVTRTRASRPV